MWHFMFNVKHNSANLNKKSGANSRRVRWIISSALGRKLDDRIWQGSSHFMHLDDRKLVYNNIG